MGLRRFVAAAIVGAVFCANTAMAQTTIKFAYLADPSREAILWAIKEGKVHSDLIKVEAEGLTIPALTQSMAARTYDVVEVTSMALPHAKARGLDLTIIGTGLVAKEPYGGSNIWVKKDSPLKTAADLEGKNVAVYSINGTLTLLLQAALGEILGLDMSKIKFIEVPVPATPAALATGRVDSAILIHAQAYSAMKADDFRLLVPAGEVIEKKTGLRVPSSMLTGYSERINKDPALYKAFLELLIESQNYALEHRAEVFEAVSKSTGASADFFEVWFRDFSDFPVAIRDQDEKALKFLWEKAKAYGLIKDYPEPASVIWSQSPRASDKAQ